MGHELGRALLLADAVSPDALAQALLASVRDRVSLVRALLSTEAITMGRLEEELARTAPDAPFQRHPVPVLELIARLPSRLCEALVAIPVRADTMTGTVDVALADASSFHAAEEIGFYLGSPVRVVRSPLGAIESALAQVRHESSNPPPSDRISVPPPSPVRPMAHTPPWGSPISAVSRPEEQSLSVSERPMPLIPKTPSERVDSAVARSREPSQADIPIPLSRHLVRRLTPGAGLVALARAAQELDDEEEPVVELRRAKPPSNPPITKQFASLDPVPTLVSENGAARATVGEDRSITQPTTPLNHILREMTKVTARDPLMELVLLAIRPTAHKLALFAVKKEAYVGWMCTSDFGDRDELAKLQLDARKPSLLSTIAAVGTYVGAMPRNEMHAGLAKFIRSQQPEVLGVTIKAAGRPVVVAIAHEVGETLKAMNVLTEVARVAGETLEKILRAKR